MKNIKEMIEKYSPKLFLLYFFLGPIFDLITSLSIHFTGTSMPIILMIKIIFLVLLFFFASIVIKSRKIFLLYYGLVFAYFISFAILMFCKQDVNTAFYQIQNLLRTFYLPLCLPSLFILFKEDKLKIPSKYLGYLLLFYIFLLVLPIITKTGFDSYAYSKEGSLGWFNSTNEISGIISILTPFLFAFLLLKKNIVSILILVIYFYICFSLGTKVPILSLIIILLFLIGYYFIYLWTQKKKLLIAKISLLLLVVFVSICFVIPKTSFYKNIQIHLEFLNINSVADLMTFEHVDHFIFSSRLKFLLNTRESYYDATIEEKLVGIGYIEGYATDNVTTKIIEMDYYDIFYRHGIIGSILYFIPFCFVVFRKRNLITCLSVFLIFLLAFFSGHILTAPSVSFLVAIILTRKEDLNENWFYNR